MTAVLPRSRPARRRRGIRTSAAATALIIAAITATFGPYRGPSYFLVFGLVDLVLIGIPAALGVFFVQAPVARALESAGRPVGIVVLGTLCANVLLTLTLAAPWIVGSAHGWVSILLFAGMAILASLIWLTADMLLNRGINGQPQ